MEGRTLLDNKYDLFEKLYNSNDIYNADMVIKNLLNRNINDLDTFKTYYDFKIKVASWDIDIPTRKLFLNEVETGLIYFSENVEINAEILEYINECKAEIHSLYNYLIDLEQNIEASKLEEEKKSNNELLKKLVNYKFEIYNCKTEDNFQQILSSVQEVEKNLNTDLFSNEQYKLYEDLTRDYSNVVSNKMAEFEKLKLKEYNKKAVNSFRYVFDTFSKDEDTYKNNFSQLSRLVGNYLFNYDSSKLLNETLIYYNQIYSFIFGKLNDEGKFKLTEIAVDSKK